MEKKAIFKFRIISLVTILVFSFTFGGGTRGLAAQESYPVNSVDLVVPFSPGGGTDLVARVFADALTKKWKKPVNVVNKPGGNCVIGTNYVMQAAPDGYTVLMDGGASSSLQVIVTNLPYKVENRTFLAASSAMPGVYVVQAKSSWRTLADVAAAAKKDPVNFTWASLGGTTQADMVLKQFFAAAGVDISKTKAVIFSGGGTGFNAVAGGHVLFGGAGAGSAVSLKGSGLIRCLAVTSPQRLKEWPEVPTTREQGFPSLDQLIWFGFSGPPGLPGPLIRTWAQTVKEIVNDPKIVAQLEKAVSVPMYLGPDEYKKYVLDECEKVKQLLGGK